MEKISIILIVMFLAGCGGMMKTQSITPAFQYGDDKRTCSELQIELEQTKNKHDSYVNDRKIKIGGNAAIVGLSLLFIPAIFLIDISDIDIKNIEVERNRYEMLSEISNDKNCGFENPVLESVKAPVKSKKDNETNGR